MSLKLEIEKQAQKRKLKNVLTPLRFLGKKFLGIRSELYSEALRTIEKADDIIRDAAFKQKVYLKDLKSMKKKLQGVRFAQAAAAFLREQELIIQIVNKIQSEFGKLTGNSSVTDINPYINKQIGLKPEYSESQKTEQKADIDKEWEKTRPGYIDRMLEYGVKPAIQRTFSDKPYSVNESVRTKASEEENTLIKEAFLENWYWKKTKSGKEYAKSFNTVYDILNKLFDSNVKLLEQLDELRSIGDPQEYFAAVKNPQSGFLAITDKQLKNETFKSSWKKFDDLLVEQDKYEKEQVENKIEDKFEESAKTIPDISIEDLSSKEIPKSEQKFEIPDLDVSKKEGPKSTTVPEIPDLDVEFPSYQGDVSSKQDVSPEEYKSSINLVKRQKEPNAPKQLLEPETVYEESLKPEYEVTPIPQEEIYTNAPRLPKHEPKQLVEHETYKQLPEKKQLNILPEYKPNAGVLPEHEQEYVAMLPQDAGEKQIALPLPEKTNKPGPLTRKSPKQEDDKSLAHNDFINQLTKLAETSSEEELACFMLSYANEIDEIDNDYALKLTAIAEGIINA
jgi:hypothetical protein